MGGFRLASGFPVFQALAKAVTIAVHFQQVAMVGQSIHQGGSHGGVLEYSVPLFKGQIGGDNQGFSLVAAGKDREQQFSSAVIQGQVAQFVNNEQIQLFQSGFQATELVLRLRFQQAINQVSGGIKGNFLALSTCFQAQGGGQMGLAGARIAQEYNILRFLQILTLGEFKNEWLIELGDSGEVKVAESFLAREAGLSNALLERILLPSQDFLFNQQLQEVLMGQIAFRCLGSEFTVLSENIGQAQFLEMGFQ